MKKQTIFQLFFAFAVFSFVQSGFAQISVGVRGGILLNNLDVDPLQEGEPEPESKIGFQVAIPVEIAIGDMFAVQPEIMYGSHGAKQSIDNMSTEGGFVNNSHYESDYTVNALEIPVLAKLKLGSESIKFHVLAGPSVGFGIGGETRVKTNFKITDPQGNTFLEGSSDDKYKPKFVQDGYDANDVATDEFATSKTNLNLHLGLGAGFDLGGPVIFLDARYILGLSDLAPDADGTASEDETTIKSNRIGVSVGVMIPL